MFFHVGGIIIRIEVGVFIGVFSKAVTENLLSDGCSGHSVEMGCGGMSKQMGMEVFMDSATVCNGAKDILQGPR